MLLVLFAGGALRRCCQGCLSFTPHFTSCLLFAVIAVTLPSESDAAATRLRGNPWPDRPASSSPIVWLFNVYGYSPNSTRHSGSPCPSRRPVRHGASLPGIEDRYFTTASPLPPLQHLRVEVCEGEEQYSLVARHGSMETCGGLRLGALPLCRPGCRRLLFSRVVAPCIQRSFITGVRTSCWVSVDWQSFLWRGRLRFPE